MTQMVERGKILCRNEPNRTMTSGDPRCMRLEMGASRERREDIAGPLQEHDYGVNKSARGRRNEWD